MSLQMNSLALPFGAILGILVPAFYFADGFVTMSEFSKRVIETVMPPAKEGSDASKTVAGQVPPSNTAIKDSPSKPNMASTESVGRAAEPIRIQTPVNVISPGQLTVTEPVPREIVDGDIKFGAHDTTFGNIFKGVDGRPSEHAAHRGAPPSVTIEGLHDANGRLILERARLAD